MIERDCQAIQNAKAPVFLGEPLSNEGTNLLNDVDGSIKFIFRKGDWDHGGFSDELYAISSHDEGKSWTTPEEIGSTGPGKQCFATISPVSGELIVFFIHAKKGEKGNYSFVRTENGRRNWSYNHVLDTIRFSGVGYGNCLWLDRPDGSKRVIAGVHGAGRGAGCYYSDDDGRTWTASNRVKVPDLIPNLDKPEPNREI